MLLHLRLFCVLAALLFACSDPLFAQTTDRRLAGFSKVTTLVNYIASGRPPSGISEERIRTVLELKLRANGLRVISDAEDAKDPDINPYVFLEISTLEAKNQGGNSIGYAYSARISVRTFARVPINNTRAPLELWAQDTMGVSSSEAAAATTERVVTELSEALLNEWLAANPRK